MRFPPLFWLGAAILLALGAWGIERLVVTDAEAIEALLQRSARTATAGDWEAFRALLAPEYVDATGRDRDATVAWLERQMRRQRPTSLEAESLDLEVEGDDATGRVRIRFHALGRPFRIDVAATFRRLPDGWRVAGAHELRLPRSR